VKPKFLHGDPLNEPAVARGFQRGEVAANKPPPPPKFSRKDKLAEWITDPDKPVLRPRHREPGLAQYMGVA